MTSEATISLPHLHHSITISSPSPSSLILSPNSSHASVPSYEVCPWKSFNCTLRAMMQIITTHFPSKNHPHYPFSLEANAWHTPAPCDISRRRRCVFDITHQHTKPSLTSHRPFGIGGWRVKLFIKNFICPGACGPHSCRYVSTYWSTSLKEQYDKSPTLFKAFESDVHAVNPCAPQPDARVTLSVLNGGMLGTFFKCEGVGWDVHSFRKIAWINYRLPQGLIVLHKVTGQEKQFDRRPQSPKKHDVIPFIWKNSLSINGDVCVRANRMWTTTTRDRQGPSCVLTSSCCSEDFRENKFWLRKHFLENNYQSVVS